MAGVFQFFTSLLGKIAGLANWFLSVFMQIFKDIWNVFTDLFCWLFDGLLGIAVAALNLINVPFNPQSYYALIPPETANMLGVIGASQALAMIVSALVIRFGLQTIPFVRWGS